MLGALPYPSVCRPRVLDGIVFYQLAPGVQLDVCSPLQPCSFCPPSDPTHRVDVQTLLWPSEQEKKTNLTFSVLPIFKDTTSMMYVIW